MEVERINEFKRWLGRLDEDIIKLRNNDHIDNIDEIIRGYIRTIFCGSNKSIENYNQKLEKIRNSPLGMTAASLDGRIKKGYVSHVQEYVELMKSLRKALERKITRLSKIV